MTSSCDQCGRETVCCPERNRVGCALGGYVHADTGSHLCETDRRDVFAALERSTK